MVEIQQTTPFVNGKYLEAKDNEKYTLLNPATNELLAEISVGSAKNINSAIVFAHAAFGGWSKTSPEKRGKLLYQLASLIRRDVERLATIECLNVGKVYAQCKGEILRAAENIEFFATEALHQTDEVYYGEAEFGGAHVHTQSFTRRRPVGVVGQIVPWNSPFVLGTWNIAPALAYGNTVVLKPSLWAPLSLLCLGELANEAGIPLGVLNIVPGDVPASDALVRNPLVSRIAFTGSDKIGKLVQIANAETRFAPVSLELGGKAANIVFADTNMDEAVMGVAWSIFRSQGQSCVAGSRALVEQSILEEFTERLVAFVSHTIIGDPMDPGVQFGPVINPGHFDNVTRAIKKGLEQGAHLAYGGKRPYYFPTEKHGNFIQPTVFTGVTRDMDLFQEEIFGPVLAVSNFINEEEAVALTNATRFGLSSNIWTKDTERALRVADQLKVGMKWVNGHFIRDLRAPFGGMKESGVGRQGAGFSRDFYTEADMTCMKW
jgi:aminomuconate-semialdehyde/2-hydroxymuconate-6-semialdehyde dehydrogenase